MALPDAGLAPPARWSGEHGAVLGITAVPSHVFGAREAAAFEPPVHVPEPPAHDRWALPRNTDGSVQRP